MEITMKMTLGELKAMEAALDILSQKELQIETSWKLAKFIKKAKIEIFSIDKERNLLIQKYGKNEEDGKITIPEESAEEFKTKFAELLSKEFEIEFEPVSIKELVNVKMSPASLAIIDKILID